MFKFAFGLTAGIVIGVVGSFIATIVGIVALEDSPELLATLSKNAEPK